MKAPFFLKRSEYDVDVRERMYKVKEGADRNWDYVCSETLNGNIDINNIIHAMNWCLQVDKDIISKFLVINKPGEYDSRNEV